MTKDKENIMVVDDNVEFLKELEETLRLCGYKPRAVCDSNFAFNLARKIKPDVILLDLKMNNKNGFHVAEELKKSSETSGIPIIAMSGYFPVENGSALLDLSNMKGCIKKPFSVSDLIDRIESVLWSCG